MTYNLTGFNGQRRDPVSGYSHSGNGYRAYNPVLMRFNCPDDMSPFGPGGINPYAFCDGDPVNRADPSGHFSLGQGIGMALGLVAGFALSVLTEGAAMPAVLTLMATVAGDAAIGAGAELATEAIDGQRINWGQVGISAGLSAVTTLAGFGMGRLTQLKGTSNRPFGGLILEGGPSSAEKGVAPSPSLTTMPNEIVQKIMGYLPEDDLLSMAKVSRQMNANARKIFRSYLSDNVNAYRGKASMSEPTAFMHLWFKYPEKESWMVDLYQEIFDQDVLTAEPYGRGDYRSIHSYSISMKFSEQHGISVTSAHAEVDARYFRPAGVEYFMNLMNTEVAEHERVSYSIALHQAQHGLL